MVLESDGLSTSIRQSTTRQRRSTVTNHNTMYGSSSNSSTSTSSDRTTADIAMTPSPPPLPPTTLPVPMRIDSSTTSSGSGSRRTWKSSNTDVPADATPTPIPSSANASIDRRDDIHTTPPSTSNVPRTRTSTSTTGTHNNNNNHHHQYQYHHQYHHSRASNPQRTKRKRKRSKYYASDDYSTEESFRKLFLRVGLVVALVGSACHYSYRHFFRNQQQVVAVRNDDDDDDHRRQPPYFNQQQQQQQQIPKLPEVWNLSSHALNFDAFAIAELYKQQSSSTSSSKTPSTHLSRFWQAAAGLRSQFAELYGGTEAARAILDRATTTFGSSTTTSTRNDNTEDYSLLDLHSATTTTKSTTTLPVLPNDLSVTACRIWSSQQTNIPTNRFHKGTTTGSTGGRDTTPTFRFAFGGYSVTVGRGNLFAQSFPLVMEQQLQTVFSLLGIQLRVRNAAVGGCPSLPYGFCSPNFWGESPDVVSWDYSMNEAGGDPIGLEAYMRHIMNQYSNKPPKLIVKDTYMAHQRRNLLQYYYNQSLVMPSLSQTVRDSVVIHTEPAVEPFIKGIPVESDRPIGFQDWRKFGTPINAPGQSSHHPAVKEHEFIAWILTMHFLSALEIVALAESMNNQTEAQFFFYRHCETPDTAGEATKTTTSLPEPMYAAAKNSTKSWNSLLFGEKTLLEGALWSINDVHCRTSFEPIVSGDLTGIVVSGGIGEELDVMLPKSKMFYNSGWVLDLGEDEKKAKRNLDRFQGHGFIDSKKGYYGIFTSGSMQLFLPYEAKNKGEQLPSHGDPAHLWFKSIVTCEVNEKRRSSACHSVFDIRYTVGGANTTQVSSIDTPATTYYGRKICAHIVVPETSKVANIAEIKSSNDYDVKRSNIHRKNDWRDDQVGLLLTVTVSNNRIMRRDDACSISHVVWEQLESTELQKTLLPSGL